MKTLLTLLTIIFFLISCTDERETEFYNPKHQIKVNFTKKEAWEAGIKLNQANEQESEICRKIIRDELTSDNIKFSHLCSGSNEKGLNFAYIKISNSYFIVFFDQNRAVTFRLNSYNSGDCLLRWVIEV